MAHKIIIWRRRDLKKIQKIACELKGVMKQIKEIWKKTKPYSKEINKKKQTKMDKLKYFLEEVGKIEDIERILLDTWMQFLS